LGRLLTYAMKTSQTELIATPQFDSGRWKLRLERAPISSRNHTKIGMKTSRTAQNSAWNLSFWFAVTSPFLGVLLGILALLIFFR
jgi:hypothetical protein